MRHYTCDKCGMSMEGERITRIDDKRYCICKSCDDIIQKGLNGKGELCPEPISPIQDVYERRGLYL
ncbi:hypothetical protein LCGC14_1875110 [marine sediment metagenome]|uniref:Uncharacterized protein n=1 Tax=marine sediment metagenome TaxID=412755 RepID=A0A0F9J2K8_9ZZZZ